MFNKCLDLFLYSHIAPPPADGPARAAAFRDLSSASRARASLNKNDNDTYTNNDDTDDNHNDHH